MFLQNNLIFYIRKKETILLTGLNLSFSDLGYLNVECDILQSKTGSE